MPTSPLVKIEQSLDPLTGFRNLYHARYGVRGDHKTPYDYFSIFEKTRGRTYFPFGSGGYNSLDSGNTPGTFILNSSEAQALYNKARARWLAKAKGESAQLGSNLGEWRTTSRMIKNRSEKLYDFSRDINMRWCRMKPRKRKRWSSFADYWLEYSFGWAPILGDIWRAAKRLTDPIPDHRVRASAKKTFEYYSDLNGNPKQVGVYTYRVLIFGKVKMTNPNLALANDLGLINPLTIAWELVRWSFVADWLFDVSSCLSSLTDEVGYSFTDTGVAEVQFGSRTQTWDFGLGPSQCSSVVSRRSVGLLAPSLPNLAILTNIGDSLTRAVNSIALTVQLVSSGYPPRPPRRGGGRGR